MKPEKRPGKPIEVERRWVVTGCKEVDFSNQNWAGSLGNWLSLNIDPAARGSHGLIMFGGPGQLFNTADWREDFLLTARIWATKASRIDGFCSFVGYPQGRLELIDEEQTREYIQWTLKLLRFAEIVYANGLSVRFIG